MAIPSAPNISTRVSSLPSPRRSNRLATVVSWELRRLAAARSTWIILLLVFVLSCFIEWVLRDATQYTISSAFGPRTFWIDWGSNYGLLNTLPQLPGIALGLYLPFLCTDGVARDLKRRTHELLMTTAVPSWAYVWGRYLSSLLASLGLACVMLLALVFVALIKHQIQPDLYLTPDLQSITTLWAIIVLPPAIILGSISFALGTMWPRLSMIIKVALLAGWFMIAPIIGQLNTGNKLTIWDPTSQTEALGQVSTGSVLKQFALQTQHQSTQLFLTNWHALEQQLPDMSAWMGPRLLYCGISIACVILAALFFRRFRNTIG